MNAPLLTPQEASRYLGVSHRTLNRLVAAGRLQVSDVAARSPRYDPAELSAYVARCRRGRADGQEVVIGRVLPNRRRGSSKQGANDG